MQDERRNLAMCDRCGRKKDFDFVERDEMGGGYFYPLKWAEMFLKTEVSKKECFDLCESCLKDIRKFLDSQDK